MLKVQLISFFLRKFFEKLSFGKLVVELPSGEKVTIEGKNHLDLNAMIAIKSYKAVMLLFFKGGLGAGESFVKRYWTTPDLGKVLDFAALNRVALSAELKGFGLATFFDKALHFFRHNSIGRAKKNISQHYDLGNDFYSQWLDTSMTYSSAIFKNPNDTLMDAQANKYNKLCKLVDLKNDDTVVEIGCGWGGLINHIKQKYLCKIKAITISEEQYRFVASRHYEKNWTPDNIIGLCDYRNLHGKFDKIFSIEMIEAVGARYWPDYFKTLKNSLKDGGVIGLQAITISEQLFDDYKNNPDFIQRYIFPGGMLPSLKVIKSASKGAGLRVIKNLDYGEHYAMTLQRWRDRFNEAWPTLENQGFDSRFQRTWEYYLTYCQAGFSQGMLNVWQLRLEHDN